MTNTPDLASIIKPLEWKERIGGYYRSLSSFVIHKINDDLFYIYNSYGLILKNEYGEILPFSTLEEAEDKVAKINTTRLLIQLNNLTPYVDFNKLQQPKEFWLHIDECPKEEGAKYDLYIKTKHGLHREPDCIFEHNTWCKTKIMGEDGSLHTLPLFEFWDEFNVLAFAEIPPCEVKP